MAHEIVIIRDSVYADLLDKYRRVLSDPEDFADIMKTAKWFNGERGTFKLVRYLRRKTRPLVYTIHFRLVQLDVDTYHLW